MNDNLQNAISQVLLSVIRSTHQVGTWATNQLPELVHQLLVWHLIADFMTIGMTILFGLIYAQLIRVFARKYRAEKEASSSPSYFDITTMSMGFFWAIAILFSFVIMITGIITSLRSIFDAAQIMITPKVWLFEYATSLLRIHH